MIIIITKQTYFVLEMDLSKELRWKIPLHTNGFTVNPLSLSLLWVSGLYRTRKLATRLSRLLTQGYQEKRKKDHIFSFDMIIVANRCANNDELNDKQYRSWWDGSSGSILQFVKVPVFMNQTVKVLADSWESFIGLWTFCYLNIMSCFIFPC